MKKSNAEGFKLTKFEEVELNDTNCLVGKTLDSESGFVNVDYKYGNVIKKDYNTKSLTVLSDNNEEYTVYGNKGYFKIAY
jgi:hypothetical protein